MKRNNLILIILFILIIIIAIGGAVFVYYKKESATELINNNQKNITEEPAETLPNPSFHPASLDWEEVVSSAPWEGRDSQAVVVYKNKIWLMGGLDGTKRLISPGNVDYGNAPHFSDVWSSEDGKNWQLVLNNAPWGNRRSMAVVDFKGKMWLMGGWGPDIGYRSDVWSSEDGKNWELETKSTAWPAREGHQLLVFQNKIWLIGGVKYTGNQLFNDVWYSDDGVSWKQAVKNAEWSPRWDFAAEVFNNKLWVVGGMAFKDKLYNDVWSSSDGVNWTLANENPPFETRQGFALIDYQNRLWVVSRLNVPLYGNGANDVWYSEDGKNWQKTEKDPLWTGREDVGAVVFKNKICIMAGMDKNWTWKNDVWCSTSD
ncbi:MAG: hypothetical protein NTY81_01230 [Candidatus Staskawiczbacteria bacterium]|nr:hypothetical protein [Candidatus Staskawiczbacteria bacterium]